VAVDVFWCVLVCSGRLCSQHSVSAAGTRSAVYGLSGLLCSACQWQRPVWGTRVRVRISCHALLCAAAACAGQACCQRHAACWLPRFLHGVCLHSCVGARACHSFPCMHSLITSCHTAVQGRVHEMAGWWLVCVVCECGRVAACQLLWAACVT
jgi:hypothetical protein